MDLRFEFGSIGCRRLWVLIAGLPPDAAIRRDGKVWTDHHELAARHIEQDAGLLRTIAEALGVKFRGPPPEPIRHPDRPLPAPPRNNGTVGAREITAFIASLRR